MSLLSFQLPDKIVMEKSDDFHGLFTFKPLQPGYGVTIGNVGLIAGGAMALTSVVMSLFTDWALLSQGEDDEE